MKTLLLLISSALFVISVSAQSWDLVGGENEIQGKDGKILFDPQSVPYVSNSLGDVYRLNGSTFQLFASSPTPVRNNYDGLFDFEFSPAGILHVVTLKYDSSLNTTSLKIRKWVNGEWETIGEKTVPYWSILADINFSPEGILHFSFNSRLYKLEGNQIEVLPHSNMYTDQNDNTFHFFSNGDLVFLQRMNYNLNLVKYSNVNLSYDSLFETQPSVPSPPAGGNEPPICFPIDPIGTIKKGLHDRFLTQLTSYMSFFQMLIQLTENGEIIPSAPNEPYAISLYDIDESGKMVYSASNGKTFRKENQSWLLISDSIQCIQAGARIFYTRFSPDHTVWYALVESESKTLVYALNVLTSTKNSIPKSNNGIFPNPARNTIHLNSPQVGNQSNFQIMDVNGKLVKIIDGEKTKNSILIEDLKPGIYMLRFWEQGKTLNFRFVKE